MDSLTHIALGAAIGEAALGRRIGARAALWGAMAASVPDIDVPLGLALSELGRLGLHRAWTHSILFGLLAATLLAVLAARRHPQVGLRTWTAVLGAAAMSHLLLDSLTSYGIQLFLPFSDRIVSIASISIIDPAYTLPLLAGVLAALWLRRGSRGRQLANAAGLVLSTAYLAFTVGNKMQMQAVFEGQLSAQGVEYQRLLVKPTLFNNLLWRGIAETPEGYLVGFRSLLDGEEEIRFVAYGKYHHRLDGIEHELAVRRLRHASEGYFRVQEAGGTLIVDDLRFGTGFEWKGDSTAMAFSYRLVPAEESGTGRMEIEHRQLRLERSRDRQRLDALVARMLGRQAG